MHLEISLIVSQILAFIIMLWILNKFAWKPLSRLLEERKQKIQSEFDTIDKQKSEVTELIALYQSKLETIEKEAQKKISAALEENQLLCKQIQEEAYSKAKTILAKTQIAIQNEKIKAQNQLKDQLVAIVLLATEKVISAEIDEKKEREFIQKFLNKLPLS